MDVQRLRQHREAIRADGLHHLGRRHGQAARGERAERERGEERRPGMGRTRERRGGSGQISARVTSLW
jgi:hypothetical protein